MATMGSPMSVLLCGGGSKGARASGDSETGGGESRAEPRAPPSPSDRSRSSGAAILEPVLPPLREGSKPSFDDTSAPVCTGRGAPPRRAEPSRARLLGGGRAAWEAAAAAGRPFGGPAPPAPPAGPPGGSAAAGAEAAAGARPRGPSRRLREGPEAPWKAARDCPPSAGHPTGGRFKTNGWK